MLIYPHATPPHPILSTELTHASSKNLTIVSGFHPAKKSLPNTSKRMSAICPPLSRYPQHSALLRRLDHTFGLSFLLWALSFPTIPTLFKPALPTQTPQLNSHERPQPEGHRRCAKLYNNISRGITPSFIGTLFRASDANLFLS